MENAQIADILDEIGDLLELKEANEFRIRSYHSAAQTIRGLSKRIEDMAEDDEDLSELPNIGEGTAEKIEEILDTGTCKRLEDLRDELPEELTKLMDVPGVGPRKAMKLHDELDVDTLDDLQQACEDHEVRGVDGFGEATENKIAEGIGMLAEVSGRMTVKQAADHAESIGKHLDDIDAIERWEVAGSFRRGKETVGDLDILIRAEDREKATEAILDYREIDKTESKGDERVTVRLGDGVNVDFRFFEPESFGAAMVYFTGSKAHNIAIRRLAVDRDWKLNEYGLFSRDDRRLAGETEEEVYERLDMKWVPPELREDRGEVDAALNNELPDLIELDDIRGDLHCHTTATDGNDSIEDMAKAAKQRGYRYLAITDHSKAVTVANGLDEDRLKKHAEKIREVNDDMDGFTLLAGIEVDIMKDGSLDLNEDVLADLDWVVASVHSYWELSKKKMTERVIRAIQSGVVDCIGHPLGRRIGKREPVDMDMDKLYEACVEHEVALEISASPERLDLPDVHIKAAREAGVKFTIDTDAHKADNLTFMRFGVANARRGWVEKDRVLNTHTIRKIKSFAEKA